MSRHAPQSFSNSLSFLSIEKSYTCGPLLV